MMAAHARERSMSLSAWLMVLAAPDATPRQRNEAAAGAYRILSEWIPRLVKGIAPCALSHDDALDILQHVADKAALGTSRFRGTTEGEAHAWVKRIVANKAIDICRARRPMAALSPEPGGSEGAPVRELRAEEDMGDVGPFLAAVDAIKAFIAENHRPNDAKTLARAFDCHIDAHMRGTDIDEQIARYGYDEPYASEPRDTAGKIRARNRVYQYRKRGRDAGCRALAVLVEKGRYSSEEARDIARFLGCKDKAPAAALQARKEAAS
jgi:DNA-directed RNA polymerase specialized sigma24 family protein